MKNELKQNVCKALENYLHIGNFFALTNKTKDPRRENMAWKKKNQNTNRNKGIANPNLKLTWVPY